jgi:hypothetical protein
LRPLALANRTLLFDLLFACAAETLLELGRDPRWLGAELGITSVLHTWTRELLFHPHVHCIVTGGGLARSTQDDLLVSGIAMPKAPDTNPSTAFEAATSPTRPASFTLANGTHPPGPTTALPRFGSLPIAPRPQLHAAAPDRPRSTGRLLERSCRHTTVLLAFKQTPIS